MNKKDFIWTNRDNLHKDDTQCLIVGYVKREDGRRHQSNTVYGVGGVSRCLVAGDVKGVMMIMIEDDGSDV